MKKKLFFSVILLAMALLPQKSHAYDFSAVAPSGQTLYYYINSNGTSVNVVWPNDNATTCWETWDGYSKPTGNLTIPSSVTNNGTTYSVEGLGTAFCGCTGLTSVVIPNTVTGIGVNAFRECTGMTSVALGNSITSIGAGAFQNCTGLTGTLTIPSSVTFIGDYAFFNCTGLCSILMPSSFNVYFSQTSNAPVQIENYWSGSHAFFGTYVEYHYTGTYDDLWGGDITDAAQENAVMDFYSAGAKMVNGYSDGQFVYRDATRRYLAGPCGNISGDITIPSTVDTIGTYAFCNCSEITSVSIPSSVSVIYDQAFSSCTGLSSITIPSSVNEIWHGVFYNCTSLTSVTVPNSVTFLGNWVFQHCTNLTSATLPNSLTKIPRGTFQDCSSLTTIDIPNSVVTIDTFAFRRCTSLSSVNFGSSVANINMQTFMSCGITSLNLPQSVTYIGDSAFVNNQSLTTLTIPQSVTRIGNNAFTNNPSLTTVNYNATYCSMGSGRLDEYGYPLSVFYGCTATATLNIGENVASIPNYAFKYWGGLNTVSFSNSVTSIGMSSFKNSGLPSISIPNSVTQIGDSAFAECSSLSTLYIGSGITSIANCAFGNCSGLSSITFTRPQPPTFGDNVFYGVASSCPVYIPCGSLTLYSMRLPNFSTFIEQSLNFSAVSENPNKGTVQILNEPTCNSPYAVVQAFPASGYRFDHWSDNSTNNPYTLNVSGDLTLTAYFSPIGGPQGIDDVMTGDGVKIISRGNEIVVEGAVDQNVMVYDVTGRLVHKGRVEEPIHVETMGVYMVKVGELPLRKVVVR